MMTMIYDYDDDGDDDNGDNLVFDMQRHGLYVRHNLEFIILYGRLIDYDCPVPN